MSQLNHPDATLVESLHRFPTTSISEADTVLKVLAIIDLLHQNSPTSCSSQGLNVIKLCHNPFPPLQQNQSEKEIKQIGLPTFQYTSIHYDNLRLPSKNTEIRIMYTTPLRNNFQRKQTCIYHESLI